MAPQKDDDIPGNADQDTSWAAVNHLMRSGYSWSGHELNSCFLNMRDGTFADVSYVSGLAFDDDGRGAAAVDWDGDGDLDLWLNNRSNPKLRLMRNEYGGGNRFLGLRLEGHTVNRDAIGSRVRVVLSDGKVLARTVRAGVNYTAQTTKDLHFGIPSGATIAAVEVRWPDGSTRAWTDLEVGGRYRLVQGAERAEPLARVAGGAGLRPSEVVRPAATQVSSTPLGVPLPLPELALEDFEGARHRFAGGGPTFVNLWATHCPGCVTELGEFVEQRALLERAGVRILACSVDAPEDRAKAAAMAARIGFWFPAGMAGDDLPLLINSLKKAVHDRYEDIPLPSSLLLDGEGRVVQLYLGPVTAARLAEDVASMKEVRSPVDWLYRASPFAGGRWVHADVWQPSEEGSQLMRMAQFLVEDGGLELARTYAEALVAFAQARRPPEGWLHRAEVAIAQVGNGLVTTDPAGAIALFRPFLELLPDSVLGRVGLAAALLELGGGPETEEAAHVFADVLPELRAPVTVQDHTILGVTLFRLQRYEEALPYLERAVQNSVASGEPVDGALQFAHGSSLVGVGRPEEGLAVLLAMREIVQPSATLESRIGFALDALQRSAEAEAYHARVLELLGEAATPAQRSLAGITAYRLRDWERTVSALGSLDYSQAGSYLPERATLGLALAQLGRDAEALEHLELAMPSRAPSAPEELTFGIVRARTGHLDRALESFTRAVELQPGWVEALRNLALAHDRLGQTAPAIERFEEVLAQRPEDETVRQRLAEAYERSGRTQDAAREYRALKDRLPEAKYRLAWLLASASEDALRNGAEAVALAEELSATTPEVPPVLLDLLAAAYAEVGRFGEAVERAGAALEGARALGAQPPQTSPIEARLALYREGRAYRRGDGGG